MLSREDRVARAMKREYDRTEGEGEGAFAEMIGDDWELALRLATAAIKAVDAREIVEPVMDGQN